MGAIDELQALTSRGVGFRNIEDDIKIDSESTKATSAEDETNIKGVINGMEGGNSKVNQAVQDALQHALFKDVQRAIDHVSNHASIIDGTVSCLVLWVSSLAIFRVQR